MWADALRKTAWQIWIVQMHLTLWSLASKIKKYFIFRKKQPEIFVLVLMKLWNNIPFGMSCNWFYDFCNYNFRVFWFFRNPYLYDVEFSKSFHSCAKNSSTCVCLYLSSEFLCNVVLYHPGMIYANFHVPDPGIQFYFWLSGFAKSIYIES